MAVKPDIDFDYHNYYWYYLTGIILTFINAPQEL